MRQAGGPKSLPVATLDRGLVAHHQRCQQTGHIRPTSKGCRALRYRVNTQPPIDALLYLLALAGHGIRRAVAKQAGRRIARSAAHIGRGLHALVPQPQLVIKTMGVAAAVRRFGAQGEGPALTGTQFGGLRLQFPAALCGGCRAAVPGHVHQRWQFDWLPVQAGAVQRKAKAHTGRRAPGQIADHTHHLQIAPFQRGRQGAAGKVASPQSSTGPTQRAQCQGQAEHLGHGAQPRRDPQTRQRQQRDQGIDRRIGQHRLLQLQRHARDPAAAGHQRVAQHRMQCSAQSSHGGMIEAGARIQVHNRACCCSSLATFHQPTASTP